MTSDFRDTIDQALHDWSVSGDAMRWTPETPPTTSESAAEQGPFNPPRLDLMAALDATVDIIERRLQVQVTQWQRRFLQSYYYSVPGEPVSVGFDPGSRGSAAAVALCQRRDGNFFLGAFPSRHPLPHDMSRSQSTGTPTTTGAGEGRADEPKEAPLPDTTQAGARQPERSTAARWVTARQARPSGRVPASVPVSVRRLARRRTPQGTRPEAEAAMTGLERRTPLRTDPAKQRAWRTRGAQSYAGRADEIRGAARRSARRRRRNDSAWRQQVIDLHGHACAACGDTSHVQADHLWPRGQGGPSHPLNGLPLCGEFSATTPGGCHPLKTASILRIQPEWLLPAQVDWLAEVGWVTWDEHGQPLGRGWRHFTARRTT